MPIKFRKNSSTHKIYQRILQSPATLDEIESYMKIIKPDITRDTIRGRLSYLRTNYQCFKLDGKFSATT